MLTEIFPFQLSIDATTIAGIGLWSLALYLGFWSWGDWTIEQLNRWFNFAERSLYTSAEEFERTRKAREAQNAFYASLFSVLPFVCAGGFCNYLVEIGLALFCHSPKNGYQTLIRSLSVVGCRWL